MNNQQNTSINIIHAIKEAWALVRGLKWPVFLFILILPVAYYALVFLGSIFLFPGSIFLSLPFLLIMTCLSFIFLWGCLAILTMLGVRQAIGLSIDIKLIYTQCMKVKDKLLYLFLIWACITITYFFISLFILPGGRALCLLLYAIIFYVKYPLIVFAIPLVVTKECDLTTALEESYQAMNRHWLQIFVCTIIMMMINFIGMIPFGIGLIWTIPMTCAMTGILFKEVFGLKKRQLPPLLIN